MISNYSLKEFFKEKEVEYLKHLEFVDDGVRQEIKWRCGRARFERQRKWLGGYYAKELKGEIYPPFEIKWVSHLVGYGVFAGADLLPKTFVAEYTGIVRRKKLFFHKSSDYCFGYEPHMGWRGFVIDAEKGGNLARFVNHSDQPNVETLGVFWNGLLHIILRTTRHVEKREQLTYDYGIDYWRKRSDKVTI